MGSRSDWPDVMSHAAKTLDDLGIAYEARVMSAHRTPDQVFEYAAAAESRGLEVIIAGGRRRCAPRRRHRRQDAAAGARRAHRLAPLNGLDSLLSMVQMPGGIPVATLSIGRAGAINAALFAAAILALKYTGIRETLQTFRARQTQNILAHPDPRG